MPLMIQLRKRITRYRICNHLPLHHQRMKMKPQVCLFGLSMLWRQVIISFCLASKCIFGCFFVDKQFGICSRLFPVFFLWLQSTWTRVEGFSFTHPGTVLIIIIFGLHSCCCPVVSEWWRWCVSLCLFFLFSVNLLWTIPLCGVQGLGSSVLADVPTMPSILVTIVGLFFSGCSVIVCCFWVSLPILCFFFIIALFHPSVFVCSLILCSSRRRIWSCRLFWSTQWISRNMLLVPQSTLRNVLVSSISLSECFHFLRLKTIILARKNNERNNACNDGES